MCRRVEEGARPAKGEVCEFPVFTTADAGQDGASDLSKMVQRCPHVPPAPPAGAEKHLGDAAAALDDAHRLMDAVARLSAGRARRDRAAELLLVAEERLAEALLALEEDGGAASWSAEAEADELFAEAAEEDSAGAAETEDAARGIEALAPAMTAGDGGEDGRGPEAARRRGLEAASGLLDEAHSRLARVRRNRPDKRELVARLEAARERLSALAADLGGTSMAQGAEQ